MFGAIKEFISQNWFGTVLSIVSIIYAIYEARRWRGPLLSYQYTGQRLIGSKHDHLPDDVQITFRGEPVTNLSQTQIVIWNNGDAPLRAADVPMQDQIKFTFGEGSVVLLAEVQKVTREVNNVGLLYSAGSSSEVALSFDFMDRNDGVLVSVWHNGDTAKPGCTGTILGQTRGVVSHGRMFAVASIRRSVTQKKSSDFYIRTILDVTLRRRFPIFAMAIGFVFFISPWILGYLPFDIDPVYVGDTTTARWVGSFVGGLYMLMGAYLFGMTRRRYPKVLTPDEFLEDVAEEKMGLDQVAA